VWVCVCVCEREREGEREREKERERERERVISVFLYAHRKGGRRAKNMTTSKNLISVARYPIIF